MKLIENLVENSVTEQKEHVNKKFASIEASMEETQKAITMLVSKVTTIEQI